MNNPPSMLEIVTILDRSIQERVKILADEGYRNSGDIQNRDKQIALAAVILTISSIGGAVHDLRTFLETNKEPEKP